MVQRGGLLLLLLAAAAVRLAAAAAPAATEAAPAATEAADEGKGGRTSPFSCWHAIASWAAAAVAAVHMLLSRTVPLPAAVAIMRKLRQSMHRHSALRMGVNNGWVGWHPDDPLPPCSWDYVTCNSEGRIAQM